MIPGGPQMNPERNDQRNAERETPEGIPRGTSIYEIKPNDALPVTVANPMVA